MDSHDIVRKSSLFFPLVNVVVVVAVVGNVLCHILNQSRNFIGFHKYPCLFYSNREEERGVLRTKRYKRDR